MRTGLLPPMAGADLSSNEAASRRVMSWLFAEKAEAVGMLLLHSAERDGSLARAGMPDAEFEHFITAAYRRAGVMGERDAVEEKPRRLINYFRNRPLAWGLAAAALIVLIILARGLFEIFAPKEADSLASRPSSTYQTASESTRTANIPAASPAARESTKDGPQLAAAAHGIQIAVPRFAVVPDDDHGLGRKIAQIISGNLGRSGNFTIIDESFFGDRASPIDEAPAFFAWRQIGAQALLIGRISQSGDGFDVRVQLWDITAGKQLSEQWYSTRAESVAEAAGRISEMVNTQLAGRNDK